jgi:hypothetical protein
LPICRFSGTTPGLMAMMPSTVAPGIIQDGLGQLVDCVTLDNGVGALGVPLKGGCSTRSSDGNPAAAAAFKEQRPHSCRRGFVKSAANLAVSQAAV